jgi:predicted DNA binding protein
LEFRTSDLCRLGLVNPRFFRHNELLEVLETFDVDADHITQVVRIRRKADMPSNVELQRREAELTSRYNLSYFHVIRRDDGKREFTALIKQRTSAALQGILRRMKLEAFLTLPTILMEDDSIISLCAKEDEMPRILALLEQMKMPFRVRSLTDYAPPSAKWGRDLTERQREILKLALELGYYEVPARVTLTGLAEVVGISKAAMSKILRRAEGRVLRSLMEG